jgi:hypothetical protein
MRDNQTEHEHDPNDFAESRLVFDVDDTNNVRYVVCPDCHRVVAVDTPVADEEAPGWLRNYTPAAPRVVRDDYV